MYFVGFYPPLDVIGKHGLIQRHVQRTWCTLYQRNATVAANRESAAYGDVVFVEMSHQHLLDAAILQVVLDGAKRAEDDALDLFKVILQA